MRRLALNGRIAVASVTLATVVAGAFAFLIATVRDFRTESERSVETEQTIALANQAERLLVDLETGHRGFVITRDERFLEPYERARSELPEVLARLESRSDEPAQTRRAEELAELASEYGEEWADRVVALARRDRDAAAALIATGAGKRRTDAIRTLVAAFEERERELAEDRSASVVNRAREAVVVAAVGLVLSLLLVLAYAAYLTRAVTAPVRRLSGAALRLSRGDLSTRVPEERAPELDELAYSFNTMAASLEEARDELESQNAELEAQQAELEHAFEDLSAEKERVETMLSFGQLLARELEVAPLADAVLAEVADVAGADVGAVYVLAPGEDNAPPVVTATRGLDPADLPERLLRGIGPAGRAVAERRPVRCAHPDTGLALRSFGVEATIRHELHLPLVHGERVLGVISFGRASERAFTTGELPVLEHLADQAAVALANALSYTAARKATQINTAVLDATTEGIALFDLSGRLVLCNTAMVDLADELQLPLMASPEERLPQLAEMSADPEGELSRFSALRGDTETVASFEFVAASGRALSIYTAPVRDGDEAVGRLYVLREITAEREVDRMKSELVATVSHELRTPLASVLGFAELLTARHVDDETRRRYLETIHHEAKRLSNLVDHFLDIQRIESGRFALATERFELGSLVRREAETFRGQSRSHEVALELGTSPLEVIGDPPRVAQVLANLLSNAIKYSPAGGRVVVEAGSRNGSVRVQVSDEGIGIPADQRAGVFEKFFRVDSSDTRAIGGTGLGLALAKEIVDAHGGAIGFDSVEGEGSTFWFELPAA